jgi:hypothetical protein
MIKAVNGLGKVRVVKGQRSCKGHEPILKIAEHFS